MPAVCLARLKRETAFPNNPFGSATTADFALKISADRTLADYHSPLPHVATSQLQFTCRCKM